jgi:hypothetical protein
MFLSSFEKTTLDYCSLTSPLPPHPPSSSCYWGIYTHLPPSHPQVSNKDQNKTCRGSSIGRACGSYRLRYFQTSRSRVRAPPSAIPITRCWRFLFCTFSGVLGEVCRGWWWEVSMIFFCVVEVGIWWIGSAFDLLIREITPHLYWGLCDIRFQNDRSCCKSSFG